MEINLQEVNRFVINMDKRKDRLATITEEIKLAFPDGSFIRIVGEDHRKPMIGCAQAHLNCIRKAKESDWDYVVIMEDDCHFQAGIRTLNYMTECFKNIPDDFGLLFGGVYQARNLKKINEYWQEIHEYSSTHFYVVPSRNYDFILGNYDTKMHIDRWYAASGLKSYCPLKMFAIQHPGYSDNVKQKVDYSHYFQKFKLELL